MIIKSEVVAPPEKPPITYPFIWRSHTTGAVWLRFAAGDCVCLSGDGVWKVGDKCARDVGVCSEDEVWSRRLQPGSKIILEVV